ncbi:energy-coupling factor transporter transmembrane component T [Dermatophilus congolensis]|uniref:energy-coupling factor transporter transmembrane component T n=4 Tax=Dermatophilus congolensis TaxID=1863 RepID=UPI00312C9DBE
MWGLRWLVVVLGVVQVVVNGVFDAFVVVGGLVVAVVAASVVTATTRTAEMMDAVVVGVRPLRCVGVDADRVGLVFSLVLRSVFVVAGIVEEVEQARKARGLERSFRALLVPVVVRTVRHGERMGEALVARGVDE